MKIPEDKSSHKMLTEEKNVVSLKKKVTVMLGQERYVTQHATGPVWSGPCVGLGNLYVNLRLKGSSAPA
jgi:hypothetical protein